MATVSFTKDDQELIRSRRRKTLVTWFWKGLVVLILTAISCFIVFPALWMISTSLKPNSQVMVDPPVWIPHPLVWYNYVKAWTVVPFTRYTINTALYAFSVVIGTVLSNSMAAYGFARLKFPLKNFFFTLLLSTMMIPGMVTMIPQYVLYAKLHWIGTYLPLIVPSFFASAFFTFMLRQFFMGLPEELFEAARIDGANEIWIWWRIAIPLSKAALATVAIWTFEGAWDDYVGPVLYLTNEKLYTLQIGLALFRSQTDIYWQYIMAASIIIMIPIIVLYVVFQDYFVEGAALSGIKG
ncbi:MAG: carbohydrate ABC transporter permease [Mycobacterium leprae]